MVSAAASSSVRNQRAYVNSASTASGASRARGPSERGSGISKSRASPETYDSEYGGERPTLGKKHIQRSIRHLEANRRERRFHARVIFREFALENDEKRMKAENLKKYMARVMNTLESDLQNEAMVLCLREAREYAPEEEEGILTKNGAVSAVIKYGEYARHCKAVHKLFELSDHSRDGKLQREELRKLIEDWESKKTRSTDFCARVVLFVTETDLDFILKSADENKDGDIDPTEAVRAIAAWEELAEVKMKDFEETNCCKGCTIS